MLSVILAFYIECLLLLYADTLILLRKLIVLEKRRKEETSLYLFSVFSSIFLHFLEARLNSSRSSN